MALVITGRSCVGKDSVVNELSKRGYSRLVTFTTRPMRENEINGVIYNFISESEFIQKIKKDFFIEFRHYITNDGVWYYGSKLDDVLNADDNTVIILTPDGIEKLLKHDVKMTVFHINVSDEEIKRRQIKRGDSKEEARRRFNADKLDFLNIDELVDYEVFNENVKPELVAETIDILYRKNLEGRSE